MKRFGLLLAALLLVASLAACSAAPTSGGSMFTLSATNVMGAEAIPVAYDVYAQLALLLEPEEAGGYDADFEMIMHMDMTMDGMLLAVMESRSTGNMRANFDGGFMQSAIVMETAMDAGDFAEAEESNTEMFMEMDGGEITFFQMTVDGELYDDPVAAAMMEALPGMDIPDITMDAILSAEVAEVGNETHISIVFDAGVLTDFIDEMLGNTLDEMLGELGVDLDTEVEYFSFVIILDDDANLTHMTMSLDGTMRMEMDFGIGEPVELLVAFASTSHYTFNYIGKVEIVMP